MTKLNEQAILVDGVPMVTLEDSIRAVFKITSEPYWHTGEPTERGTYLVSDLVGDYAISYFDGKKFGYVKFPDGDPIEYWHKIPPYEEQK